MTDRSKSVYASAPFKFIVNGEPLYIHADLVSFHSKPLMAEAQKGFANLEDVDEGTFVRFIEWAHKGYYTAADFRTVDTESPSSSKGQSPDEVVPAGVQLVTATEEDSSFGRIVASEAPPEPPSDSDQWGTLLPSRKKGKKAKKAGFGEISIWQSPITPAQDKRKELEEAFVSRKYTARQSDVQIPPPRSNQSPSEDYTDVFLSHAQLYVFAEKYDIQKLKTFALEELHATLARYTQYSVRTGDITALLRYVYDNTVEPKEGPEDMRTLMTEYVGYEMDVLMDDEDFKNLMIENGGSLLGDFMTMVRRRIS